MSLLRSPCSLAFLGKNQKSRGAVLTGISKLTAPLNLNHFIDTPRSEDTGILSSSSRLTMQAFANKAAVVLFLSVTFRVPHGSCIYSERTKRFHQNIEGSVFVSV